MVKAVLPTNVWKLTERVLPDLAKQKRCEPLPMEQRYKNLEGWDVKSCMARLKHIIHEVEAHNVLQAVQSPTVDP